MLLDKFQHALAFCEERSSNLCMKKDMTLLNEKECQLTKLLQQFCANFGNKN